MSASSKADHFSAMQSYIKSHGMREEHIELLDQCLKVQDDLGDFDLLAACGWAKLADQNLNQISVTRRDSFMIQPEQLNELFPLYEA